MCANALCPIFKNDWSGEIDLVVETEMGIMIMWLLAYTIRQCTATICTTITMSISIQEKMKAFYRMYSSRLSLTSDSYIRRISFSPLNLLKVELPKWLHHSKSMELQISLNQGVYFRPGCSNSCLSSSAVTYLVSWTSFGLTSTSTSALIKRI